MGLAWGRGRGHVGVGSRETRLCATVFVQVRELGDWVDVAERR